MKYSVVIPVYNSEASLRELHHRLVNTFAEINAAYELIFVDDFSKDNSWEVLKKIKFANPDHVKILRLAKNYGQHNSVLCGFRNASGERIITIDDDLQQAPEDILILVQSMDNSNADLVYGIGRQNHSTTRKIGSQLYKKGSKYIDGKYGEGSSFRLLTSSLLKKVIAHKQHFVLIEELLFWYTEYIEVVKVNHYSRKYGNSGYSPLKIFKYVANISINYSNWPLKFMIYGGAVLSVISFLLGLFFIYKKVVLSTAVPGFTALIVTIFFSTSILLLCFGIVGKYLNNIYIVLNDKPAYSVKESYL